MENQKSNGMASGNQLEFAIGDVSFKMNPVQGTNDFHIGETLVTQALWKSVMGTNIKTGMLKIFVPELLTSLLDGASNEVDAFVMKYVFYKSIVPEMVETLTAKGVDFGDLKSNGFVVPEVDLMGLGITDAEFESMVGDVPRDFPAEDFVGMFDDLNEVQGDDFPIFFVSRDECQVFIDRLNDKLASQLDGKRFAFPTEAEWEYAAKGGQAGQGCDYSGSNDIESVAWYSANSGEMPHPVAKLQCNELGLYDMNGNVWEWCADMDGTDCVIRGGSSAEGAEDCRIAARSTYRTDKLDANELKMIGFRLALR